MAAITDFLGGLLGGGGGGGQSQTTVVTTTQSQAVNQQIGDSGPGGPGLADKITPEVLMVAAAAIVVLLLVK